jgi:hypothetical protein
MYFVIKVRLLGVMRSLSLETELLSSCGATELSFWETSFNTNPRHGNCYHYLLPVYYLTEYLLGSPDLYLILCTD